MTAARLALAVGLAASGGLLAVIGGWWGLVFGLAQGACAVAIVLLPVSPGPVAGAVLALVVPAAASIRHWAARLPGVCHCARLPHAPPPLVSLTGLAVLVDVMLIGLALPLAAAARRLEMRQSSP